MSDAVRGPAAGPAGADVLPGPTWDRLEDQIGWYERKAQASQRSYKQLKVVELVVAAVIPPLAGLRTSAVLVSALATAVVVLEGVQHLFQWNERWIAYRSTSEALKHERYLFLASAGPYAASANTAGLLAERVEGVLSQENARWATSQQQSGQADGAAGVRVRPPTSP